MRERKNRERTVHKTTLFDLSEYKKTFKEYVEDLDFDFLVTLGKQKREM